MTTTTRPAIRLGASIFRPLTRALGTFGNQIVFLFRVLTSIPLTLRHYSKEVTRLVADVTWGNGTLVAGGGTIGVVLVMCAFGGMTIGIEAYNNLSLVGVGELTGSISALGGTREIVPILATLAFVVQAGCRFTAELGAMRISEEIDALESIAIRPMPYLITTRVLAVLVVAPPLYLCALVVSFLSTELTTMVIGGVTGGTYAHYFNLFLVPSDIGMSILKLIVLVTLTTFIQCYYGFFAAGGPVGVGVAAGRAIRLSIITMVCTNLALSLAIWGSAAGSARISG
ncbi:ABC transporter permease [Nocardia sp. NPDC004068]|uniref:ABC transporter permease n=1 Tax=Nocardia sp. NPDC004068 TaxID=3364303 RepID=UPI0036CE3DA3